MKTWQKRWIIFIIIAILIGVIAGLLQVPINNVTRLISFILGILIMFFLQIIIE